MHTTNIIRHIQQKDFVGAHEEIAKVLEAKMRDVIVREYKEMGKTFGIWESKNSTQARTNSSENKLMSEGLTVKRTKSSTIPYDDGDDRQKDFYDVIDGAGKVVGQLRTGMWGSLHGKLYGRDLPELSSYAGQNPQAKLDRFLQTPTGKKWIAVSQKNSSPISTE